jgi:hypothetical protein
MCSLRVLYPKLCRENRFTSTAILTGVGDDCT